MRLRRPAAGAPSIAKGKVVSLQFRLTDETGEELERTEEGKPLHYIHGTGTLPGGLERRLEGHRAGEALKIVVPPRDAYGEVDQSLRRQFDISVFPSNPPIEVGELFRVTDVDGSVCVYEIERIEGDKVWVNGNHPLAGRTLHFEVQILDIREATPQERQAGQPVAMEAVQKR